METCPSSERENEMKNRNLLLALPALMLATSTFAGDYPEVKAGLWSTTATNADARMPPQSGTMCTSNDVIKALADMQKGKNLPCKVLSRTQSGSTYTSETECSFGGTVRKTTSVTTATSDTALHTEIHGSDGALVMTNDMKYVGACPAGMVPGDFTGANGMHYNVLHAGAAPGAPVPPH
jgi:hypothetical protein